MRMHRDSCAHGRCWWCLGLQVERHLDALVNNRTWKNPELATLLWNCLPNTLDTTVWQAPTPHDPRSFISTGDIAAMWLRDSQNQVLPYMRFAKAEPDGIGLFIRGLIKRHGAPANEGNDIYHILPHFLFYGGSFCSQVGSSVQT